MKVYKADFHSRMPLEKMASEAFIEAMSVPNSNATYAQFFALIGNIILHHPRK